MDYHTFLLTNFSAIIWKHTVFVLLSLIKLLWSIKTIVLIVFNTSLRSRTGEESKVTKWTKAGMLQKTLGTTGSTLRRAWCEIWNDMELSGVVDKAQSQTQTEKLHRHFLTRQRGLDIVCVYREPLNSTTQIFIETAACAATAGH